MPLAATGRRRPQRFGQRLRGRRQHVARLEHEGERIRELLWLELFRGGLGEGGEVRTVRQHAIVQADAAGEEAVRLGVIAAIDQAHELRHDVEVIPGRAEAVLRHPLYAGSVKDVYGIAGQGPYVFDFSDRYSIFDWGEMPDSLPGKGEALAVMGDLFFRHLARAQTWSSWKIPETYPREWRERWNASSQLRALQKNGLAHHSLGLVDSLVVGCSQAIALIPGVSRSGATILGAMLLGSERRTAAEVGAVVGPVGRGLRVHLRRGRPGCQYGRPPPLPHGRAHHPGQAHRAGHQTHRPSPCHVSSAHEMTPNHP